MNYVTYSFTLASGRVVYFNACEVSTSVYESINNEIQSLLARIALSRSKRSRNIAIASACLTLSLTTERRPIEQQMLYLSLGLWSIHSIYPDVCTVGFVKDSLCLR